MQINKWRLIDTGFANASYNMAVDEMLLNEFDNSDMPVLRLYEWKDSLSFGRFSSIKKSVDLDLIDARNISYSRRMSGGGILVHGGDISYSLIVPKKNLKDTNVRESYRYLCSFLINFYKKLSLDATFAQDANLKISKSNICMASNEPYDITVDSKKIGGNAQRYTKNMILQHGSIPLKQNDDIFKDIFLEDIIVSDILTLDKLGIYIDTKKIKCLLIEAFKESFEVEFIKKQLSTLELKKVYGLQKQKYDTDTWNIDAKHN